MSGPNNNDRETLGKRVHSRQTWAEIFGWLVGVGLLVEYWDEIVDCLVHWHWPSQPLFGGMLVTAGVFLEVLLSRLALNASDELQRRADSDVAQSNERAAQALDRATKAEQATAEARERAAKAEERIAELGIIAEHEASARVRLQSQMIRLNVTRWLSQDEQNEAIELLREYKGQRFTLRIAEENELETIRRNAERVFFAQQLEGIAVAAGWEKVNTVTLPTQEVHKGITIFSTGDAAGKAAAALAGFLNRLQIHCGLAFVGERETLTSLVIGVGLL
jgi:hypothetical protein